MSKRLTIAEVRNRIGKFGYSLIGEYINNQIPIHIEKDGYWYSASLNNIEKNGKASRFGITNPYLAHNFQVALTQRHSDAKYVSHKIVRNNRHSYVLVTLCCKCGKHFIKDGSQILSTKINLCCSECYKIHKSRVRNKDRQSMIDLFHQNGYKIIQEPQLLNATKLWVIEDSDGYRGKLSYGKLRNGQQLSIYGSNNRDLRVYNAQVLFNSIGSKSVPVKMVDNYIIQIQCECGEVFECLYYRLFDDIRHKCPKCNNRQSKYEFMVSTFLSQNHIAFKEQFVINSCRDKLPLPFDFWLKDYNILIEVDGQQHFQSIEYWGSIDRLAYIQKHDAIKTEYCEQYNIPLLRIPYTEFNDNTYKQSILSFIQTVQD